MSQSKRLLVAAFGASGYGFGRVIRSLLPELQGRGWSPTLLDLGGGEPVAEPWNRTPRDSDDPDGLRSFSRLLGDGVHDVVLVMLPSHLAGRFGQVLLEHSVPGLAYLPIDSEPAETVSFRGIEGFQSVAVFTDYAQRVLRRTFARTGIPVPVQVIPHGVDAGVFHPLAAEGGLSGRQLARRAILGEGFDEAFIVLNANRNTFRKDLAASLRGFAEFARRRPDVFLWLHSGKIDAGINTLGLARELGVVDRVLWPHWSRGHPIVDNARLNLIYNACDVGINTSQAEGWGLVAFEHAATGAPQLVPDHTSGRALWKGHGMLLPAGPSRPGPGCMYRPVDPTGLTAALEQLHADEPLRRGLGLAARQLSNRADYSWGSVGGQFDDELTRLSRGNHGREREERRCLI